MSGSFYFDIVCLVAFLGQCTVELFALYGRHQLVCRSVHDEEWRHSLFDMTYRTGFQSLLRITEYAFAGEIGKGRAVYQQSFGNGR